MDGGREGGRQGGREGGREGSRKRRRERRNRDVKPSNRLQCKSAVAYLPSKNMHFISSA